MSLKKHWDTVWLFQSPSYWRNTETQSDYFSHHLIEETLRHSLTVSSQWYWRNSDTQSGYFNHHVIEKTLRQSLTISVTILLKKHWDRVYFSHHVNEETLRQSLTISVIMLLKKHYGSQLYYLSTWNITAWPARESSSRHLERSRWVELKWYVIQQSLNHTIPRLTSQQRAHYSHTLCPFRKHFVNSPRNSIQSADNDSTQRRNSGNRDRSMLRSIDFYVCLFW